jgi:hypothetical protein
MISDDRMQKALTYLAETDEEAAMLYANMERLDEMCKSVKDAIFLHETGTIPERQAKASNNQEYEDARHDYFRAVQAYKAVANKRSTEELVVRAWQTVSSNRRQGGI